MRLGGKIFQETNDPASWVQAHKDLGYTAAYSPVTDPDTDDDTIRAYADAAKQANLLIAEVGAWRNNTISTDEPTRKAAVADCAAKLSLADRIGARCCVNIAGSRVGADGSWNGPAPTNCDADTFDLLVQSLREIIDAAKPTRTHYTLEMSSWGHPDSAETYLQLISAVDRDRFAVHLDPVNIVNCPARYYGLDALLTHTIRTLGPWIRSCHAKDVTLAGKHLVHLDECRPGTGRLSYAIYLTEVAKLDPDTPIMLEHLPDAEQYALAADHLRSVANQEGLSL